MLHDTGGSKLYELLNFEKFGARCALQSLNGRSLNYSELAKQSDVFQARLPKHKSLILLRCDNSLAAFVAFFGALRGGHAVALCDDGNEVLFDRLIDSYHPEVSYDPKDDALVEHRAAAPVGALHRDLAMVLSTSGSTGASKCARISNEALIANSNSIATYLRINAEDTALLTLPMHYCYGLSVVTSHLSVGAKVIVDRNDLTESDFQDRLVHHKVTTFPCVPYSIEILEARGFRDWKLPDLRYLTQAGGALRPDLVEVYARWAADTQKEFFVMYGATEATSRMAYLPPDQALANPDTIGIPIPGGRLEIRNEVGEDIHAPAEPGELVYSGANVMDGYAFSRDDLAQGRSITELITGDIAERTEAGLFRIIGRKSRFAKLYGKRFNLQDLEMTLGREGVTAAIVSDDRLLSVVYEGSERDNRSEVITKLLSSHHGIAARDIRAHRVEALPFMSSGKTNYAQLKDDFLTGVEEAPGPKVEGASTQAQLKNLYEGVFKKNVSGSDSFRSLAGDSLNYVQISIGLESILGVLPENWDKLSLDDLSRKSSGHVNGFWAMCETAVVLRVAAIFLVMFNHGGIWLFKGGAHILLAIAGYSFARFQLDTVADGGYLSFAKRTVVNVLIPFWFFVLLWFGLTGEFSWATINLTGHVFLTGQNAGFGVWFVHTLFWGLCLVIVFLMVPPIETAYRRNPFVFSLVLLGLGLALRAVHTGFIGDPFGAPPFRFPVLANVWVLFLGMAIGTARNRNERLIVAALGGALMFAFFFNVQPQRFLLVTLGLLVLALISKVPVPRFVSPFLVILGSASMFIYLVHQYAGQVLEFLVSDRREVTVLFRAPFFAVFGSVVGVILYLLYDRILLLVGQCLRAARNH